MLIEQFFSSQIFIRRDHNIVKIAVCDLQVIEIADIAFSGNLWTDCDVGNSRKLTLLHKAQLLRVIVTPFQCPALLFLKFKHTSTLSVNFQYIEDTSDVNKTQSGAVAVNANNEWQWLPEQL